MHHQGPPAAATRCMQERPTPSTPGLSSSYPRESNGRTTTRVTRSPRSAGVELVGFARADEILTPPSARRVPPRRKVPVQSRRAACTAMRGAGRLCPRRAVPRSQASCCKCATYHGESTMSDPGGVRRLTAVMARSVATGQRHLHVGGAVGDRGPRSRGWR
jgi:hypothetical protein